MNEPQHISNPLKKTLEIVTQSMEAQTTRPPESSNWSDKKESARRKWLGKWLPMRLHHPKLTEMAHELYRYSSDLFHKRQGRGLIIYGANGCGKSMAQRLMLKWFNHVRMNVGPVLTKDQEGQDEAMIPNAVNVLWPEIVDGFKQEQWLIVNTLQNEYFVGLDDIGAEHDPSQIGAEKLYLILSRREFKFTIITTNVEVSDWQNRFERRIASRLFRNFTHIDLSGVPDYATIKS